MGNQILVKGNYIVLTFDIEFFQLKKVNKDRNLAFRKISEFEFLPEVIKVYNPFDTVLCKYYTNNTGQVISFYKIEKTLNEQGLLRYFNNYGTENDKDKIHDKIKKDIEVTFGVSIEPDTVSILSIDEFDEKIKWDHYRIDSKSFQSFLESQFIFQLTKSFDKNLNRYQLNFNNYYRQKIMLNLAPSLFSVTIPRDFIINDDETKGLNRFYEAWSLTTNIQNLKEKFRLLSINSDLTLKEIDNRQNLILNFFLLSLTLITTISIIPSLKRVFPEQINEANSIKIILTSSILVFIFLFFKPLKTLILNIYYWSKNKRTYFKMKKNRIE